NRLTRLGEIAKEQVEELKERYEGLIIDNFVIMPNHVHILLSNYDMKKRETVIRIIGAYKSRTANLCRESGFDGKLFQTSFYDRIVRNRQEYEKIYRYIDENPMRWNRDMYF
ncbi:MAG: transposase, partial [Clostridia bacterium]|nr:transposase [Clostridia bacterium]